MTVQYVNATDSLAPVKEAKVANGAGYLDLVVAKRKNGKAIGIYNRTGTERVCVTLDKVESLIEALQAVKARGVKQSTEDLSFSA